MVTIVLFVLFAGGSVTFREYFARRWRAEHGVTIHGFRAFVHDLVTKHPPMSAEQMPPTGLPGTSEGS